MTVSAQALGLGPVRVSVGAMRPATGWGLQWLEHDLVLENTGRREVTFADTWRPASLGLPNRPMLLAEADGRCSFRAVRPLRAACVLPLLFVDIEPGRSVTRVATLWKGLEGMSPLVPGEYTFWQPLRFRFGSSLPVGAQGRAGGIKLVYRVTG